MDSPLLPSFGRHHPSSDNAQLLADMSLSDLPAGDDSFFPGDDEDDDGIDSGKSPLRPPNASASASSPFARAPHTNDSRFGGSAGSASFNSQAPTPASSSSQHHTRTPIYGGGDHSEREPSALDTIGAGKGPTSKPRFSLFAAPRPLSAEGANAEEDENEAGNETVDAGRDTGIGDDDDQTIHARARDSPHGEQRSAERDDRLRESLYELRRMNEVFDGFLGALEAARGHNERLAVRVKQTSALLDQYTAILGQAEHTQTLLMNPNWTGAQDDAAILQAEEQARFEAEEAHRLESERAAEAARLAGEAKERRAAEAERAKQLSSKGSGGVGGTRGRSTGRVVSGTTRGRGSGIPTSSSTRPAVSGIPPPAAPGQRKAPTTTAQGTVGRYGHVQSSGYGPGKKA